MRLKKYLSGGQVELDKNKDGKITAEDFKLMKAKKKGMYAKGGMKMYAKDGSMVKALKKYANGGETDLKADINPLLTKDERRQVTAMGNQPSASYKGYKKKKSPKDILEGTEMLRLKTSLQKMKYPASKMSLQELRKVAKKEGVYDAQLKLAREDYQKAMDKIKK